MADHVCPWWIGYLLASPIRAWFQNPQAIVGPHVQRDMTVLDVGCTMGFFSLPMAEMVGPEGKVVCLDVQDRMIRGLERRAARRGLGERIDARVCDPDGEDMDELTGQVDFALAFAMVHEADEPAALMGGLFRSLVPGGRLLISEPRGHVTEEDFDRTISLAETAGFVLEGQPDIARSLSALMMRPAAG